MKRVFVTGISTEVGKTVASAILVEALQADYWKPVQAGDLHQSDSHKIRDLIGKAFRDGYRQQHFCIQGFRMCGLANI